MKPCMSVCFWSAACRAQEDTGLERPRHPWPPELLEDLLAFLLLSQHLLQIPHFASLLDFQILQIIGGLAEDVTFDL